MKHQTLILGLAAPFAATADCGTKWKIGQTVPTTSGLVHGHPAPNATKVSEYLGIPYAMPPIDKLRFQAPVRYNETKEILGDKFVSTSTRSPVLYADFARALVAYHPP